MAIDRSEIDRWETLVRQTESAPLAGEHGRIPLPPVSSETSALIVRCVKTSFAMRVVTCVALLAAVACTVFSVAPLVDMPLFAVIALLWPIAIAVIVLRCLFAPPQTRCESQDDELLFSCSPWSIRGDIEIGVPAASLIVRSYRDLDAPGDSGFRWTLAIARNDSVPGEIRLAQIVLGSEMMRFCDTLAAFCTVEHYDRTLASIATTDFGELLVSTVQPASGLVSSRLLTFPSPTTSALWISPIEYIPRIFMIGLGAVFALAPPYMAVSELSGKEFSAKSWMIGAAACGMGMLLGLLFVYLGWSSLFGKESGPFLFDIESRSFRYVRPGSLFRRGRETILRLDDVAAIQLVGGRTKRGGGHGNPLSHSLNLIVAKPNVFRVLLIPGYGEGALRSNGKRLANFLQIPFIDHADESGRLARLTIEITKDEARSFAIDEKEGLDRRPDALPALA